MNDIEQPSSSSLPSRSTSNNALDLGSTASNGTSNGANNNNSAPSLLTTIRTRLDTIGQGWFNASYLVDWMLCIIVMSLSELIPRFLLNPFERIEQPNDPSLYYPDLPDTVPVWALLVFGVGIPLGIFALAQLRARSWHDFHSASLSLVESLTLTLLATDMLKHSAGRYRPDWHERSMQGPSAHRTDGRLSFPSGHSSVSFCFATVAVLYLIGKTGVLRGSKSSPFSILLLCLSPFGIAGYVAVSRTQDYHHHFSDILAGSVIGFLCGCVAYFLNYPSVMAVTAGIPKRRESFGCWDGIGRALRGSSTPEIELHAVSNV